MAVARYDEKERAKPISAWDVVEKLDGKETKVMVVEVTLKPGQAGEPHRPPARGTIGRTPLLPRAAVETRATRATQRLLR